MIKKLLLKIAVCTLLFSSFNAFGQFLDSDVSEDDIFLVVGEIRVMEVNSPKRVSVRNPEIADVGSVSNREITLVAKQPGNTVLTVWDIDGEKLFYVTVHAQDVDSLKRGLEKLINEKLKIAGVSFKKNNASGKVMVIGEVTVLEKTRIDKILMPFTENIDNLLAIKEESQMVEIDCHILELTKSFSEVFGLNWTGTSGSSPTKLTQLTSDAATGKFKDVFRIIDFTRTALDVQLMAAVNSGKGKILAKPKLLCLSGGEANFLVGGEMPVVTVTSSSTGDTIAEDVEYKEYGIKLNIQPVVFKEGDIKLNLAIEVKELSTEGQYVRSDDTTIKAFVTRTTSTVLRLKPGQGVVISGLFKDKVTKDDVSKIPGLGDIPILGALFRSKDYQDSQTELIITLTPRIITQRSPKKKPSNEETFELPAKKIKRTPSSLIDYTSEVQKKISQALVYPVLAQGTGWQGALTLGLSIAPDGKILEAKIIDSSGYMVFDEAALKTVRGTGPYPSFPKAVKAKNLWIEVPIVYGQN